MSMGMGAPMGMNPYGMNPYGMGMGNPPLTFFRALFLPLCTLNLRPNPL
jgi:hypothetical protein